MNRIVTLKRHLTAATYDDLPLPPIAPMKEGSVFPTFQEMKEDAESYGGVFTYKLWGGRRLTVLADPKTYEIVFHPGEYGETEGVGDAVRMEMDKIAHAWFGIPKEVCPWTRDGLNAIRVVLSPSNGVRINEIVGSHLRDTFDSMPASGSIDLVRLASHTFKPVNAALFGPGNVPDEAEDWFHAFDENLPQLARGIPMKAFEEMVESYERIVKMFENAIESIQSMEKGGVVGENFAPAITERIAVLRGKSKTSPSGDFSTRTLAQFMVSIFWAPQANTLPMTAWMLAHVLNDPRVYKEVCKEVRTPGRFGTRGRDVNFDASPENIPYTSACLLETLRLYIANLTHRVVTRQIRVTDSISGKDYRIPQGHMLTLASYLRHYDSKLYPSEDRFVPERWLDRLPDGSWEPRLNPQSPSGKECPVSSRHAWFPFSKGRFSCSGQHLAKLEIPTLVALFLQRYDAELDVFPEADWDDVVASVRPEGWPYEVGSKVIFRKR